VIGLTQLAIVCQPINRLRGAVLGGMTLAFAGAVLLFGGVFFLTVRTMPAACWLWLLALLALAGLIVGLTYQHARRLAGAARPSAQGEP
jgi:hypothetical protein